MIISGGVNIYPAEIEAVLYEHPQLLDAAVFGVPDEEWGERVYAVVQAKPGETVDLDEVREFVSTRARPLHAAPRVRAARRACPAPTPASSSSGSCATSTGATATPRSDSPPMGHTLAEHESLALLRERGIPAVEEAVVDTPDAAGAAARSWASRWW